MRVHIR